MFQFRNEKDRPYCSKEENMLNILFMGTPDFAQESLKCLVDEKYNIVGVVTNPDRPKGRGMKMIASPVKEYALEKGLDVYQPERVRKNIEFIEKIKELNPDIICVVAYGKILPKEILDIPKYGCVNVHASILPKYRGAAPIQWAVLNGDKVTGVTTMYMDVGMDTGDTILVEETKIGEEETTGELWNRLSKIGGNLLVKTLKQIEEGTAPRKKQGEDFTMAPMLNKEMSKIDWENKTAVEIHNLVRGLNPIMGAYTFLNDKKIKIWKTKIREENELLELFPELEEYFFKVKDLMPGTIMFASDKKGLFVKANEGIIEIKEIQGENAKKMPVGDFLRGNEIMAGEMFE